MTSTLYQQIQQFYDASSGLWEQTWGEHMHHGYYGPTGTIQKQRRQAQIDLNEEFLAWGEVTAATQILDAGCGIGGSALYLAEKYQAQVIGITLSPVQAERATERAAAAGLSTRATFQVADAQDTPFEDQQFDLIWSMESGEHMPDKGAFVRECYRLLKPGGRFLMATWCHRPTTSLAGALTADEQRLLAEIYRLYALPYVISLPEYEAIATECGFQQIRTADWSTAVAPFWDRVIESALNWDAIAGLIKAGWPTIQGTFALGLMRQGFQQGTIRYGLLTGIR
ncbi:methyltransferase domain-containing protein [Pseudanabaena sp. FACHB-2040]|uniref:methyltransferase domain-containing protein n=1 Tax=Pseudanabaena sp. FACHB-2040 TaxID=2692859 RepID=UPI001684D0C5|nr:methyltransferase domain-containing protein [Pseudanabaena sp. FACHB-2040]MBD2257721.1 methyltransferase domain-containing protein [Pseudanabaena sp. FACHB-2040]